MVIHTYAKIWYAYVKEQRRFCLTLIHGENIILILRLLLKDLTKSLTEVKSSDLSIMHDTNVMPKRKLSYDWLKTHTTE